MAWKTRSGESRTAQNSLAQHGPMRRSQKGREKGKQAAEKEYRAREECGKQKPMAEIRRGAETKNMKPVGEIKKKKGNF